MENYQIAFDINILEFEKQRLWGAAADYAFQLWLDNPENRNNLLCAGTQLWFTLLSLDDMRSDTLLSGEGELLSEFLLQKNLMAVTRFGFEHFSNDSVFNAYFGYMISLMPYFFLDYNGDYVGWQEKGLDMIRLSFRQDPNNLLAEALCFELDGYDTETPFYNTCRKIWNIITSEQWGYSNVLRYFFNILYGNAFCATGVQRDVPSEGGHADGSKPLKTGDGVVSRTDPKS